MSCFIVNNCEALATLLFAVIGGCFALCQWHKGIKIKRAEFINQIIGKLRFDNDLAETMRVIDQGRDRWYANPEEFYNGDFEIKIDKLFSYLDYICYLQHTRNITQTEFSICKYEIHRVCNSPDTKCYTWNLYHFSKKNNSTCSFHYLINYAIANRFFPKDFKENETLYEKILNW